MQKGKLNKAHKIVFGKPMDNEIEFLESKRQEEENAKLQKTKQPCTCKSMMDSVKDSSSELIRLYGSRKLCPRLLICHSILFVTSLTYYVVGMCVQRTAGNKLMAIIHF